MKEKIDLPKDLKIYVGLEIHQQLDTGKLHCRCKGDVRQDEPDYRIIRKLHISESELGEFDIAALRELRKRKWIIYECYYDNDCLIDIDEEPPLEFDKEAFEEALRIAAYFDMWVPDEVHVMRKIFIDGSVPTGFQRTTLIGLNGKLIVDGKEIKINTLCLEEESGRKIKEDDKFVYFRLDRLGIPLVEISTGVIELNPENVGFIKRVAEELGITLRFFKVRRGLGTIRQDVNVSIEGGGRVELKGVQDLNSLPKIVLYEAYRQYVIITKIKNWVNQIKLEGPKDLTKIFENTQCKFLKRGIKEGKKIYGIKVINGKGLFGFEIQPGKRFGKEIAEYVSLYSSARGILHRDELPNYGITEEEVNKVCEELGCSEKDNFILYMVPENERDLVFELIKERLEHYKQGVYREVRKINPDCTSSYMRPLPTSARMYPETDLLPVRIDKEKYEKLKVEVKKEIEEIRNTLEKEIKDKEKVKKIIREGKARYMFELIREFKDKVKTSIIVKYFYDYIKEIGKEIELNVAKRILEALSGGKITKEAIEKILEEFDGRNLEELLEKYRVLSEEEVRKIVKSMLDQGKSIRDIYLELRGKADMRLVSKIINELRRNK